MWDRGLGILCHLSKAYSQIVTGLKCRAQTPNPVTVSYTVLEIKIPKIMEINYPLNLVIKKVYVCIIEGFLLCFFVIH